MSALVWWIGVAIVGGFLLMALAAAALMLRNYLRQRALRHLLGLRRAP